MATAEVRPGLRQRRAEVLGRRDLTGRALTTALAAATDKWLRAVFAAAAGGGEVSDVALLAVGGYGRGELAPGSDLDLVLVHRSRRDIGQVAEAIWYPIWDGGMALDHSVRTARDVGGAMDDDLRVALGLLDARTVAGSGDLGEEVRRACADKWVGRAKRWLPEVARTVRYRHESAGDLAFLLEPDLKEARGGLRDLHQLLALARVTPALADLVAGGRLDGPWDVLTAARVELQRATGRPVNRLTLQDQDTVAAALRIDADRLVADVADAARTVAWASDDAWRRVERLFAGWRPRRRLPRDPIEPGVVLREGEVTLAYGADPAADPTLALRAAAASAELDLPLSREAIDAFAGAAGAPAGLWPVELRDALLRLLGAGRAAIPAWETLDQQGVVVRLIPEWRAVRNRPQRNAYHRFTVDRHLLETAANAVAFTRRVSRPDLLLLGALLHDIGKGYPGDHTDAGIEVVGALAPRLGLDADDVATLQAMVRLHLLLPEVATRRDLDDPATIAGVADAVGDRDTLELLAALAEADGLATGPAAWGAWKAGLVARLVDGAGRVLDGHPPPEPPAPTPAQQALLDDGHLAVVVEGSEVTVVAPDRPGLLAAVAGVLAVDGAAVRSAATRSLAGSPTFGASPAAGGATTAAPAVPSSGVARAAGAAPMALLVLQVTPAWDVLPTSERLCDDIAAALAGTLPLAAELAERQSRLPRRRPTAAGERTDEVVVTVDHAASAAATLVEVRAPDRLATLWRISQAICDAGVVITAALVATLGAEVVDVFYVQDPQGAKLDEGDRRLKGLEAGIVEALRGDASA